MVDILLFMVDKETVKTNDVVVQFRLTSTTAKRYMRQLVQFGYIASKGGNKNRSYAIIWQLNQI